MNLEEQIERRLVELGMDETITPFVLEELSRVQEAKALGTIRGKPDKTKQQQVGLLHQKPRFVSSLRAHSRIAGKRMESEVKSLSKLLKSLHVKYKSGDLTRARYRSKARIALKSSTELAFQLGVKAAGMVGPSGALRSLTPQEKKWVASYLKEELKFFDKFLKDVTKGSSDRKAHQRLDMYASTIKSAFNSGRVLSVGTDVIIHWELESKNPCPDCRLLSRMSPYTTETLPTVPKGGQTRCLSHCYCTLRIVKSNPADVKALRSKKKSASWHLKKLKANRKKRN